MREELKELLKNSYAPYSKYNVSAICVMKDNQLFGGVNIENASYGATVCAERVAIFKAISKGYRKGDFKELHIMVNSDKIGTPCFMCRQVFTEFFDRDMKVYMYSNNDMMVKTVDELCPYPFDESNL
jgi:cytidine deaminase